MHGLMMNMPLNISALIQHADRCHGDTEIVSRTVEGGIHRYTYSDAHRRSRQLANALTALGVKASDRIGTLAWNGYRHFEIYFGSSGIGAVCTPSTPGSSRTDHLHRQSRRGHVRLLRSDVPAAHREAGPACKGVRGWVAMTDRAHMPASSLDLLCYEDLVNAHSDDFEWPVLDENLLRRSATPREPRATPRACCTAIAPRSCMRTPRASRMRSTCRRATWSCPWCRCSM
jgi:3-(methylthio)propionyl---CoA ligase